MHLTMHLTIIKYCWYVYKKTFFFCTRHTLFLKTAPVAGQDQASEVGPEAARHGAVESRANHCDLTGMMVVG